MALTSAWRNKQQAGDILYIALLIVLAVGGVCLTFPTPAICALTMAMVGGLALWRWHTPQDVLLAVSGIVFGPTLEFFATTTGLWAYPHTSFGTLPAWVFALWPVFPLCLVRLTHALLPPDGESRMRAGWELGLGLAILAAEIPLLCALGTSQPMVTTIGTAVMLAAAFVLARSPQAGLMLAISGIVGPVCESLPVALGAWGYPNPHILGLPMWLPTGYALFGFAVVRVAFGLHGVVLGVARQPELAREQP
ncbi:MAG: hypothetical protein AB2A00_27715 [Myxococcota bacterium]